jgi:two-component system nitrate/nitrite response regulator NarL
MLTLEVPLATDPTETPVPEGTLLRVLIADDHPLFRQGMVRALVSSGLFEVAHEAADGATALALLRSDPPDVAVLDLRMPGMDGIDVVAALARNGPAVPVVLLSAFDDEQLVAAGLEAGAAAYLSKTADREVLCREIAAAAHAQETRSAGALHGGGDFRPARVACWTPRLTGNEYALLRLARDGWDKPDLAFLTGVDEATMRRRLDGLLAKLGVDDLGEALDVAAARGVIRAAERLPGGA